MLIESQYFPCIAFWAKAREKKRLTIEAHENYQKRSYRNKCSILSVNKPLTLSIPLVKGKHGGMPIQEVRIASDNAWRNQHKQSIQSAYGNAAYFEFYWDDISALIDQETNHLFEYNRSILHYFSKMFQIDLDETKSYEKQTEEADWRQRIIPKSTFSEWPSYDQVFSDRHPFVQNLSILDALFCLGPACSIYLNQVSKILEEL